jgi:DNA-directed RNA polymerase specialized sigma24 family protein
MATAPIDREALAREYLPRAEALAVRLTRAVPWEGDEARSVAAGAVAEAIRRHDGRGEGFENLLFGCVRAAVVSHLRTIRPKGKRGNTRGGGQVAVSGRPPVPISSVSAFEFVSSAPPVGWEAEYEDTVRWLAGRLEGRQADVILLRYLHAETAEADGCAASLGISLKVVMNYHSEALAILRRRVGGGRRRELRWPERSKVAAGRPDDPGRGGRGKNGEAA